MRRALLAEGEYAHIYNRGVEKRRVFLAARDYERFLFTLFACNDANANMNARHQFRGLASIADVRRAASRRGGMHPLVEIICFCLLPNHFHLLLKQLQKDGIARFMQKVGTAFTMYFNTRYEHAGVVFQGPYRSRRVDNDAYFLPLTRYIHLNTLDLFVPDWRETGFAHQALDLQRLLVEYPWSSYGDYQGHARYSYLLSTDLLRGLFPDVEQYADYVLRWTRRSRREVAVAGSLALER